MDNVGRFDQPGTKVELSTSEVSTSGVSTSLPRWSFKKLSRSTKLITLSVFSNFHPEALGLVKFTRFRRALQTLGTIDNYYIMNELLHIFTAPGIGSNGRIRSENSVLLRKRHAQKTNHRDCGLEIPPRLRLGVGMRNSTATAAQSSLALCRLLRRIKPQRCANLLGLEIHVGTSST